MRRVRLELVTAVIFGAAAVSTLIWPRWIEALTAFEPDGGSGEAEWWIVGVIALIASTSLIMSLADYRTQRRLRSAE